jgi:hypothetical protein
MSGDECEYPFEYSDARDRTGAAPDFSASRHCSVARAGAPRHAVIILDDLCMPEIEIDPETQMTCARTACFSPASRPLRGDASGSHLRRNGGEQKIRLYLGKKRRPCYTIGNRGIEPGRDRLPTRRKQTSPKLTSDSRTQPEMAEGNFFTPTGRNPLKRLDSEK